MPPYFNFFPVAPISVLLIFFLLSIVVPGVFIWIGLKVIGRDRGIIRCGIANFAAFTITAALAAFLHLTPLVIFLPLIAFLVYLYVLKSLLDISFIEAFAATIIATVVVFIAALVMMIIFGVWLLFTPPPPHTMNVRF